MSQIIRVTSEALQRTVRRLLPSQQGFGEDLQATNVIQPIIDLTPSAEGSEVRQDLQTALSFNSQTVMPTGTGTNDVITTTGFYRVFGVANVKASSSSVRAVIFTLDDGSTTKDVYGLRVADGNTTNDPVSMQFDFVVFLNAGEKLTQTVEPGSAVRGSTRQIATINGELVNPAGFTPQ